MKEYPFSDSWFLIENPDDIVRIKELNMEDNDEPFDTENAIYRTFWERKKIK